MTKKFLMTPIRRLDGITYWVIEDPEAIHDFINTEIRREWEEDVRFEGRDQEEDLWLKTLLKRKWILEIIDLGQVKLNPAIMNLVDKGRGYVFQEELANRSKELQESIRNFSTVIWPIIIKKENFELVDGYCRFTSLRAMNVSRTYAYVGTL
jgi:hypothetical protein